MNREYLPDIELRIRPNSPGRSVEVWIHRGRLKSEDPSPFEWRTPSADLWERVEAIVKEIGKLARDLSEAPDISEERIRSKAMRLAELVPEGLVRTLKIASAHLETLMIDSFEPWFPWELLWLQISGGKVSSGRYLADAFDVARWHGELSPPIDLPDHKIAWVTLDSAKLPGVAKERSVLAGIVGAGREIVEAPRTWEALRPALEAGGFDIWHFAGEGSGSTGGDPDTRGLTLENYLTLAGEDLLALKGSWRSERPLVFLNACRSGVSGASSGPARGLPIRFLEAGAGALLATLWQVSDAFASAFAAGFYQRVLTGCSILLTNRIPSDAAFRAGSKNYLQRLLAGRAATAELWGPQEIAQAAFNAMATRLLQLALTGGIENLERLRPGSTLPQAEPVDQVPLSRSFLVTDQYHLREESSRENVIADPAFALAEPRGEHFTLLLGEFGFGKTTALERAIRVAGDRQVLYLPGASIDQQVRGTKDLLERLLDLESMWGALEGDEREILRLLARPALQHLFRDPDFPVVLAIDGLDESAYLSRKDGLQQLFNSLANVQVPVVLAMRSEYWNEMEEDFRQISGGVASHGERRHRRIKRIELRDWQPPQIADFLIREIAAHPDPGAKERLEALADSIDRPEFEALYGDIPRRPLFLRFIVDTVADEGLPAERETRVRLFEHWVHRKIARDIFTPSVMSPGGSREPLVKEGETFSTVQTAAWEAMVCAAAAMCETNEERLELLPSCTLDRALSASPRLRSLVNPLPLFLHSLLNPAPSRLANPKRIRFSHRAFQEFFLAWAIHHYPELPPRGEAPSAVRQWVDEIAQASTANLPAADP